MARHPHPFCPRCKGRHLPGNTTTCRTQLRASKKSNPPAPALSPATTPPAPQPAQAQLELSNQLGDVGRDEPPAAPGIDGAAPEGGRRTAGCKTPADGIVRLKFCYVCSLVLGPNDLTTNAIEPTDQHGFGICGACRALDLNLASVTVEPACESIRAAIRAGLTTLDGIDLADLHSSIRRFHFTMSGDALRCLTHVLNAWLRAATFPN